MNAIFNYKQANVTFKNENGKVFVNATEMAKSFGTKPDNWLRTEPAKKMIGAIAVSHICDTADLLKVIHGGNLKEEQGTWMHEDVALVFAQWLSPEFYIWCNTKIKELLKTGVSTITNDDEAISYAMQVLSKRLEEANTDRKLLKEVNTIQQGVIESQAPRVLFAQAVETSYQSILIGELAKLICQNGVVIGQNRLFKELRETGYLCNRGDAYNQPTQKAMDLELFEIKKSTILRANGNTLATTTTKVTGKGQVYFVNKYLKALKN